MEFISQYSGIFALIPLIIVLVLFLKSPENDEKEEETATVEEVKETKTYSKLDLNDEDATVACLVASIDYRNETHKNVRIVCVKEVR